MVVVVSDAVLNTIIGVIGGVITTYLTVIAAKKVQQKKAERQPKDRMEQMFDGYERLINAKDIEDQRKAKIISALQESIDNMEQELASTRHTLSTTQSELVNSNLENKELKKMLHEIRDEYKKFKAETQHKLDKAHA